MRREVAVPDTHAERHRQGVALADPEDKSQVGASIPGMVSKVNVKPGDARGGEPGAGRHRGHEDGDRHHRPHRRQRSSPILVKEGQPVKAKELLMELE